MYKRKRKNFKKTRDKTNLFSKEENNQLLIGLKINKKICGCKIKRIKLFIIFIFIIILSIISFYFHIPKNNNHNKTIINVYNNIKNIENKTIDKNSTNNKGFLLVNTTHKGKFTIYDYVSNIKIYKDLYNNIEYVPITNNNSILDSKQLSKEEYSKICEDGILLDSTKYKRNKSPKISVVIPYFNRGLISPTKVLRSIQNQSLKDVEIIFVDDGSYDDKIKDILIAMKDDNRIILLRHKEQKTTLLTRVDGIRYASGEYIIQIDQDDMFINNLLFEQLYKKAKELNVDMIQFFHFSSPNLNEFILGQVYIPHNVVIKQPDLKTAFFAHGGKNRLGPIQTRMIWNKFVRRITFLEAIEDLGDEYMNHKFRCYEDTIMSFELSQIADSFFYYPIDGYRHCTNNCGKLDDKNETIKNELWSMNQLIFIKLLIHKIDPKYDRSFLNREFGFGECTKDAKNLNKNDLDLGLEVIEGIFELERIYKNTDSQLLDCVKQILEIWGINNTKRENNNIY